MDYKLLVRIVRISPKCSNKNPCESDYCFHFNNGRRANMRVCCSEPWSLRLQNPDIKLCEKTFRHSKEIYNQQKSKERIAARNMIFSQFPETPSPSPDITSSLSPLPPNRLIEDILLNYDDKDKRYIMNELLSYFGKNEKEIEHEEDVEGEPEEKNEEEIEEENESENDSEDEEEIEDDDSEEDDDDVSVVKNNYRPFG